MTEEQKQALIKDCRDEISKLERAISNVNSYAKPAYRDEFISEYQSQLQRQQIALAALTAQPDDWKQRAEAAEAKLADLAKQAAAGTVWINCTTRGTEYEFRQSASINIKNGQELFTRAAPAADLAELVPDAKAIRKEAGSYAPVYSLQEQQLFIDGATWLSAAILRNIEEAK